MNTALCRFASVCLQRCQVQCSCKITQFSFGFIEASYTHQPKLHSIGFALSHVLPHVLSYVLSHVLLQQSIPFAEGVALLAGKRFLAGVWKHVIFYMYRLTTREAALHTCICIQLQCMPYIAYHVYTQLHFKLPILFLPSRWKNVLWNSFICHIICNGLLQFGCIENDRLCQHLQM